MTVTQPSSISRAALGFPPLAGNIQDETNRPTITSNTPVFILTENQIQQMTRQAAEDAVAAVMLSLNSPPIDDTKVGVLPRGNRLENSMVQINEEKKDQTKKKRGRPTKSDGKSLPEKKSRLGASRIITSPAELKTLEEKLRTRKLPKKALVKTSVGSVDCNFEMPKELISTAKIKREPKSPKKKRSKIAAA